MSERLRYFDADENVRMMRDTAKRIGLIALLRKALTAKSPKPLIREALRLLGVRS